MQKMAFALLVAFSTIASAEQSVPTGLLIQKRNVGKAKEAPELLYVEGKPSRLTSLLAPSIGSGDENNNTLPYLIVPDEDFVSEIKKRPGCTGKPANHVMIRRKEVVLLKASEFETDVRRYPGIGGAPANQVMIDGVRSILVDKAEYHSFLKKYAGIAELPANYIVMGKEIVQVIPVNRGGSSLDTSMGEYIVRGLESLKPLKMSPEEAEAYRKNYNRYVESLSKKNLPAEASQPEGGSKKAESKSSAKEGK